MRLHQAQDPFAQFVVARARARHERLTVVVTAGDDAVEDLRQLLPAVRIHPGRRHHFGLFLSYGTQSPSDDR